MEGSAIREQMQVLTSSREFLGTVDGFDGDSIRVKRGGGEVHSIPAAWVEHVDDQVHLNRSWAEVEAGLKAAQFHPSDKPQPTAAAPAARRPAPNQLWIWLIVAIVLILLLVLLF